MRNSGAAESLQKACEAIKETTGNKRLAALFDEGSLVTIDSYAKSESGFAEAAAGYGTVEGCPVYAFAQSSDLDGGAVSKAQSQKIRKVFSLAAKTGTPVVGIYDSIGGRLREGADLLTAYGEILLEANRISGVVPQIALVLGPCVGTSAMIAACADFVVMSAAGELTIAPNGEGGSADQAARSGDAALVADTEAAAIAAVRTLVAKLPSNNLEAVGFTDEREASGVPVVGISAKEAAQAAASAGSLLELSAAFGKNAYTAFGSMGTGATVGLVAYDGTLDADACAKAARFIRFCDAYNLPIVSFVNADRFISLRAASMLSDAYAEATTAKVSVLTGNAYGPVYIAVAGRGANADYTMAWPDAIVSALAPETGAVFLWNDRLAGVDDPVAARKQLFAEYARTEGNPMQAAAQGLIEDVIAPEQTRERVARVLDMLSSKRVSTLPKKHSNIQL